MMPVRSQTNARSWVALFGGEERPPLETSLSLDQNNRWVDGKRRITGLLPENPASPCKGYDPRSIHTHRHCPNVQQSVIVIDVVLVFRLIRQSHLSVIRAALVSRVTRHVAVSPPHPAAKPIELRLPRKPDLARCRRAFPCFALPRRRRFKFGPLSIGQFRPAHVG
jgi:hypothetical protein